MTGWFRTKWRDRQWRQTRREFVYLDEVSVTSLVAARHGSIAETITDSLSKTSEFEVNSSASVPVQGAKLGLGSRLKTSETTGKQVVRRAVIQGTFRDLRAGDSDLAVAAELREPRRAARKVQTVTELEKAIPKLIKAKRAVRVDNLRRGDVIELEVTLEASWIYQIVTTMSSVMEMVEDRESLFGLDESQVAEFKPMLHVLENMLVGLVPISGTATGHKLLDVGEHTYLIDTRAITPNSEVARSSRPFAVVGVTELPCYWKDLRRVLFNDQTYTAYVRVAKPGLTNDWNPVKLADVLETVVPSISEDVRRIPEFFNKGITPEAQPEQNEVAHIIRDGLVQFGQELADVSSVNVAEEILRAAASRAAMSFEEEADLSDVDKVRPAYERIVEEVRRAASADITSTSPGTSVVTARATAEPEGGPDGLGQATGTDQVSPQASNTTASHDAAIGISTSVPVAMEADANAPTDALDRELVRTLREASVLRMKAELTNRLLQRSTTLSPTNTPDRPPTEQLEVEFVAIYW
jgi:hypothetical protein